MNSVQTPALVDVELLVSRLNRLILMHKIAGRISHSHGARSALNLIKREIKSATAAHVKVGTNVGTM